MLVLKLQCSDKIDSAFGSLLKSMIHIAKVKITIGLGLYMENSPGNERMKQ